MTDVGGGGEKQLLAAWPLLRKANWGDRVNASQIEAELSAVYRGSPFGDPQWSEQTVRRLSLESTLRPQGRPKRQ